MMDSNPFGFGFTTMFSVVPIFIIIIFVIVFGILVFRTAGGVSRWNTNNNSPILTVHAKVVSKRSELSYRHNGNVNMHSRSYTHYFVTFEDENNHRIELPLKGEEYGVLMEGDSGNLTFQGTRYKGFERSIGA